MAGSYLGLGSGVEKGRMKIDLHGRERVVASTPSNRWYLLRQTLYGFEAEHCVNHLIREEGTVAEAKER